MDQFTLNDLTQEEVLFLIREFCKKFDLHPFNEERFRSKCDNTEGLPLRFLFKFHGTILITVERQGFLDHVFTMHVMADYNSLSRSSAKKIVDVEKIICNLYDIYLNKVNHEGQKSNISKIVKIHIVNVQGAILFMVGQQGIKTIDEEILEIGKDIRAKFYTCRDENKQIVAQISANAPVIVEWES